MATCIFDSELKTKDISKYTDDFLKDHSADDLNEFVKYIYTRHIDDEIARGKSLSANFNLNNLESDIKEEYHKKLYRILGDYSIDSSSIPNYLPEEYISNIMEDIHKYALDKNIAPEQKPVTRVASDSTTEAADVAIIKEMLDGNFSQTIQSLFDSHFNNHLLRNKKTNFIDFFKHHIANNSDIILGLYGNTQSNIDSIKNEVANGVRNFFDTHSSYKWGDDGSDTNGSLYIVKKSVLSDNLWLDDEGIVHTSSWLVEELNKELNSDYKMSEINNIISSDILESGNEGITEYLKNNSKPGTTSSIITKILGVNNNSLLEDYLMSIPGKQVYSNYGLNIKVIPNTIGDVEYNIVVAYGYDPENIMHRDAVNAAIKDQTLENKDINIKDADKITIANKELIEAVFSSAMTSGFDALLTELYPYINHKYMESYRKGFSDTDISFSDQESGRQKFIKETTRRIKYVKNDRGEYDLVQDSDRPYLTSNDFDAISKDIMKYKSNTKKMIDYIRVNGAKDSMHRYKDIFTSIYNRFFDMSEDGNYVYTYDPVYNISKNVPEIVKSLQIKSFLDPAKTDDLITSLISMLKTNTPLDKANITNGVLRIGDINSANKLEYASNTLRGKAVTRDMGDTSSDNPLFILNRSIKTAFRRNFRFENGIITLTSPEALNGSPAQTMVIEVTKNSPTAGGKIGAEYKVESVNGNRNYEENIDALRAVFTSFGLNQSLFNPNFLKYLNDTLYKIDHRGARDNWLGNKKYTSFLVNNLLAIRSYLTPRPESDITNSFILREGLIRVSDKIIGSTVSRYVIQNGKAIPGQSISSPLSNMHAIIENAINNDGLMNNSIISKGGIRFNRTVYKGTVKYGDEVKELKNMEEGEIAMFNIRDLFLKSLLSNKSKNSVLIPGKTMGDRSLQPNYEVIIPSISNGIYKWNLIPSKGGKLDTDVYENQLIISNKLYFDSMKRRVFDKWLDFFGTISGPSNSADRYISKILNTTSLESLNEIVANAFIDKTITTKLVRNNNSLTLNLDYVTENGTIRLNKSLLEKERLYTGIREKLLVNRISSIYADRSIVTLEDVRRQMNADYSNESSRPTIDLLTANNSEIKDAFELRNGVVEFTHPVAESLYGLMDDGIKSKILRSKIRYELDGFKSRIIKSGFDSDKLTTFNLSSIDNMLGRNSRRFQRESLFDSLLTMYYYNVSGIGNELHRLNAGPVEQYDPSYEKIGSGKLLTSAIFSDKYSNIIDAVDGKITIPRIKEELINTLDNSPISSKRRDIIGNLINMLKYSDDAKDIKNNNIILKAIFLDDISASASNSMLNQTKRNTSQGSGGIVPVEQDKLSFGFKLEDHSKVVTFSDPTAVMTALGSFATENGFELYNGMQLALPLWEKKMNNSIGNDYSNFKINNNSVKDIVVGPTKEGINIVEKKSVLIISPEMIKRATPEFNALLRNMMYTIKWNNENGESHRVFIEDHTSKNTRLTYDMWVEFGGSLGTISEEGENGSIVNHYDSKILANIVNKSSKEAENLSKLLSSGKLSVQGSIENVNNLYELYVLLGNKYSEEVLWDELSNILSWTSGVRGATYINDFGSNKLRFKFNESDNPYKYRNAFIEKIGFLSEKKTGNSALLNPEYFVDPINTINNGFLQTNGAPIYAKTPNIGEYIILNSMETADTTAVDSYVKPLNVDIAPTKQADLSLPRQALNAAVFGSDSNGVSPKLDEALSILSTVSTYRIYEDILSTAHKIYGIDDSKVNSIREILYKNGIVNPDKESNTEIADTLRKMYRLYVSENLRKKLEISSGVASTAMDLVANGKDSISYDLGVINAYMSSTIHSEFKNSGINVKVSGNITTLEAVHHIMRIYKLGSSDALTREEFNERAKKIYNGSPILVSKPLNEDSVKYLQNVDLVQYPPNSGNNSLAYRTVREVEYDALRDAQNNGIAFSRKYLEDYILNNGYLSNIDIILKPDSGRELKYMHYYKIVNDNKVYLADTPEVRAKELVTKLFEFNSINRADLIKYDNELRPVYESLGYANNMSYDDYKTMLLGDGEQFFNAKMAIIESLKSTLINDPIIVRDFYKFFDKNKLGIVPEYSINELNDAAIFFKSLQDPTGGFDIEALNNISNTIMDRILGESNLIKARLLYNIHKELLTENYVGMPAEFMAPSMHATAMYVNPEDTINSFIGDAYVPDYRELIARGIFKPEYAKLFYSDLFRSSLHKLGTVLMESNPEIILPIIKSIDLNLEGTISTSGELRRRLFPNTDEKEIADIRLAQYMTDIQESNPAEYDTLGRELELLKTADDIDELYNYPSIIKNILSDKITNITFKDNADNTSISSLYDTITKTLGGDELSSYSKLHPQFIENINILSKFINDINKVRYNIKNTVKDRISAEIDSKNLIPEFKVSDRVTNWLNDSEKTIQKIEMYGDVMQKFKASANYADGDGNTTIDALEILSSQLEKFKNKLLRLSTNNYGSVISTSLYQPHIDIIGASIAKITAALDEFNNISNDYSIADKTRHGNKELNRFSERYINLHSATKELINGILDEVKHIDSTKYIADKADIVADSFLLSLEFYTTRIPTQGKPSTAAGRIAQFYSAGENLMEAARELTYIQGSDHDHDHQHSIAASLGKDGDFIWWEDYTNNRKLTGKLDQNVLGSKIKEIIDYTNDSISEKQLSRIKKMKLDKLLSKFRKATSNFILHNLVEETLNPVRALEVFQPLRTNDVYSAELPDKLPTLEDDFTLGTVLNSLHYNSESDPSSDVQMLKRALAGKEAINFFASGTRGYGISEQGMMAMSHESGIQLDNAIKNTTLRSPFKNVIATAADDVPENLKQIVNEYIVGSNSTNGSGRGQQNIVHKGMPVVFLDDSGDIKSIKILKRLGGTDKILSEDSKNYISGKNLLKRFKKLSEEYKTADDSRKLEIEQEQKSFLNSKDVILYARQAVPNTEVWEQLSQLITASVDNVKELILGKINSNSITNSMITTMVRAGLTIPESIELITELYSYKDGKLIDSVIHHNNKLNPSKQGNKTYGNLATAIIAEADQVFTSIAGTPNYIKNIAVRLSSLAELDRSLNIVSQMSGIISRAKVHTDEIFQFIDRLSTINKYKFDFARFINDAMRGDGEYVKDVLSNTETSNKSGINPASILFNNKMLVTYFDSILQGSTLIDSVSTADAATKNALKILAEKYKNMFYYNINNSYKSILRSYSSIGIIKYLQGKTIDIHLPGEPYARIYDLGADKNTSTKFGREQFILDLPDILITAQRVLPNNTFLDAATNSILKVDETTNVPYKKIEAVNQLLADKYDLINLKTALEELRDAPDIGINTDQGVVKAEFSNKIYNMLFYYSLIVNRGMFGSKSFSGLFGDAIYKPYSDYLLANNNGILELFSNPESIDELSKIEPGLVPQLSTNTFKSEEYIAKLTGRRQNKVRLDDGEVSDISEYAGDNAEDAYNLDEDVVQPGPRGKREAISYSLDAYNNYKNSIIHQSDQASKFPDIFYSKELRLLFQFNYDIGIYVPLIPNVLHAAIPFEIKNNKIDAAVSQGIEFSNGSINYSLLGKLPTSIGGNIEIIKERINNRNIFGKSNIKIEDGTGEDLSNEYAIKFTDINGNTVYRIVTQKILNGMLSGTNIRVTNRGAISRELNLTAEDNRTIRIVKETNNSMNIFSFPSSKVLQESNTIPAASLLYKHIVGGQNTAAFIDGEHVTLKEAVDEFYNRVYSIDALKKNVSILDNLATIKANNDAKSTIEKLQELYIDAATNFNGKLKNESKNGVNNSADISDRGLGITFKDRDGETKSIYKFITSRLGGVGKSTFDNSIIQDYIANNLTSNISFSDLIHAIKLAGSSNQLLAVENIAKEHLSSIDNAQYLSTYSAYKIGNLQVILNSSSPDFSIEKNIYNEIINNANNYLNPGKEKLKVKLHPNSKLIAYVKDAEFTDVMEVVHFMDGLDKLSLNGKDVLTRNKYGERRFNVSAVKTEDDIKAIRSIAREAKEVKSQLKYKHDNVSKELNNQAKHDLLSFISNRLQTLFGDSANIRVSTVEEIAKDLGISISDAGKTIGYNRGNDIILSENFDATTPFHEITHIFMRNLRFANPELHFKLIELAKSTAKFNELTKVYSKLSADEVGEEVIAELVGIASKTTVDAEGLDARNKLEKLGFWGKIKSWFKSLMEHIFGVPMKKEPTLNDTLYSFINSLSDDILHSKGNLLDKLYKGSYEKIKLALSEPISYEGAEKLLWQYGLIRTHRTDKGVETLYLESNGKQSAFYYDLVNKFGKDFAKYNYITHILNTDTKLQKKGGLTNEDRLEEMRAKPTEGRRSPTSLLRDDINEEVPDENVLMNKWARSFIRDRELIVNPNDLEMDLLISAKMAEKVKNEKGEDSTYGDELKKAGKLHNEAIRRGGSDAHDILKKIMSKVTDEISTGKAEFVVNKRIDLELLDSWASGIRGKDSITELNIINEAVNNSEFKDTQSNRYVAGSFHAIMKDVAAKINEVADRWQADVNDLSLDTEMPLYDKATNLFGTPDLVVHDNKSGRVWIFDYKGKSEKNYSNIMKNYDRKYKGVYSTMDANSINDAAIQMGFYGTMYEDAGYNVTGGSAILLQIGIDYSFEDFAKEYERKTPLYKVSRFTNIVDTTVNTQLARAFLTGKQYKPEDMAGASGDITHMLGWGVSAGEDPGILNPVLDHSDDYVNRYVNNIQRDGNKLTYAVKTSSGYMNRITVDAENFNLDTYKKDLKKWYKDIMHEKLVLPSKISTWFNSGKSNVNEIFRKDSDVIATLFSDIDPKEYTVHIAAEYNKKIFGDLGSDVLLIISKDGKELKLASTLSVQNKKLKFNSLNKLDIRNTLYGSFATDEQVMAETDVARTYDIKPTLHELYAMKLAIAAMRYKKWFNNDITINSMKVSTVMGSKSDITYHSMETEIGKLRVFQSFDKAFPEAIAELLDELPANVSKVFTYDSISALSDLLLHDTRKEFVKSMNIGTNAQAREVYELIKTYEPKRKLELEFKIGKLYVNLYNSIKGKTKAEKVIDPKLQIIRNALLNLANINTVTKQIMFTGKLSELYPIRSLIDAPDYYVKKFEVVREKYMRVGADKIDRFHREHIKLIKALTGGRTSMTKEDYLPLYEDPTFSGDKNKWMKMKDISKHPELTKVQKAYIRFFNENIGESLESLSSSNAAKALIKEGHIKGLIPIMFSVSKIDTSSPDAFFKSVNRYVMPRPKLYSDVDKDFKADRALEYKGKFREEITDNNTQFSDRRREILGVDEPSTTNLSQIEMNPSIILHSIKFSAETEKVFSSMTMTVNALLDELYSREIKDHWDSGRTVDFILKMWSMTVQNQFKDDQFGKQMDKVRRYISTLLFGANVQQIATETATAIIRGTTSVFQQSMLTAAGGETRFKLKDWGWANKALFSFGKGEDNWIYKVALDNGMFYTDLKEFGSNSYTRLNKGKATQRDLVAGGNTAAHNQFRFAMFTAMAKHDGVIDAYRSGRHGRFYDETLDKRFYTYDPDLNLPGMKTVEPKKGTEDYKKWLVWKAVRNRMVEDGFINEKTNRMEKAYIAEERTSMNEYISHVFGSMRDDSRIYWDFFGISRQLTLYKRWASMKVTNYFTKTHDSYKNGYWELIPDGNGGEVAHFTMAPREGIFQTIGSLTKAIYNTRNVKGTLSAMKDTQRENLSILISDVMTAIAITTVGTLIVNAHKKDITSNPFYLAMWKGSMNAYSELNVVQLLLSMNTEVFPAVSILTGTLHNLGASVGYATIGQFNNSLHELGKTKSFFGGLKTARSIGYFIDPNAFGFTSSNKMIPIPDIDPTVNMMQPKMY